MGMGPVGKSENASQGLLKDKKVFTREHETLDTTSWMFVFFCWPPQGLKPLKAVS